MNDVNISELLKWLYGLLKEAKINLGRAESRPGVTQTELDALKNKAAYIDYLIGEMIKKL
jgi:hypothetical protein